jgi:hypothetical protein
MYALPKNLIRLNPFMFFIGAKFWRHYSLSHRRHANVRDGGT